MPDLKERLHATLGNRYTIEREIGVGGMATVYLARDLKHDRDVALKVLRPELSAVLGVDRFLNEIKIAAQLDHPHILTLIDSGEAEGLLYYVLPYVRGESLRKRLDREKQLSVDDALAITRQIASALDYAHTKGVVHRDVKPENILLHEGEAILTDFGIAMAVKHAGGNRLTETGLSLGTPQYMSPEQATGDRTLDARSDVYSLGAVLYEMLAGEPPHTGPTSQAVIAKLMTERPTRLRVVRDTVPEGVDVAVAKALAKVPADRYTSATNFSRALEASAPAPRFDRGKWSMAIAAGVAAAIVLGVLAKKGINASVDAPPPQRVQLTTTGNAFIPSMSPDGSRIAFAERYCDAQNRCFYRLVVQDVDGTDKLIVSTGIVNIWLTNWTPDGRFLLYTAVYGDEWGAYAVSTLGGARRHLGCCHPRPLIGDTVVVFDNSSRTQNVAWVRYFTVRDGIIRDSLAVPDPGFAFEGYPTDDPNVIVASGYKLEDHTYRLRLIDRRGKELSRYTMKSDGARSKWIPRHQSVLLAVSDSTQRGANFLRLRVSNGKFETAADTIVHDVEIVSPSIEASFWFSVAPDGGQLLYGGGANEGAVWTLERTANGTVTRRSRQPVATSTARLLSRISPDGKRVALVRTTATGRGHDVLLLADDGGTTRQLTAPLDDIRVLEWKTDGSGLLAVNFLDDNRASILEVDTSGRATKEILRTTGTVVGDLRPLRDGSFLTLSNSSRNIQLFDRAGKSVKQWDMPGFMPGFEAAISDWSDKRVAVASFDSGYVHITLTRLDMQSGSFTPPLTFPFDIQICGRLFWLDDGRLVVTLLRGDGTWGLYNIPENNVSTLIADLPFGSQTSRYTISRDGRSLATTVWTTRSDVYSIRNFGALLTD